MAKHTKENLQICRYCEGEFHPQGLPAHERKCKRGHANGDLEGHGSLVTESARVLILKTETGSCAFVMLNGSPLPAALHEVDIRKMH